MEKKISAEEAFKKYAPDAEKLLRITSVKKYNQVITAMREYASQDKWISIKDKSFLEDGEQYIVELAFKSENCVICAMYENDRFMNLEDKQVVFDNVIRYQPLPLPPNHKPKQKGNILVVCTICGKPITETGTVYNGRPVHIECYHKAKQKEQDKWISVEESAGMKDNEYLRQSIQQAIAIHGKIIRESSYGGSTFIVFEDDVCYRLNFQVYNNEVTVDESSNQRL